MSKQTRLVSRRDFLKQGVALAAASATVPSFLAGTVRALQAQFASAGISSYPGVPDDHVLVVVQLSGGNDGLNTIIPFNNDSYFRLRPTLAVPKRNILALTGELGMNPGLAGLKELYDKGRLAIVQGVGYPNPDRSHFRSMEIWQSGVVEDFSTAGWVDRLFDDACRNRHLDPCSPTAAISVGQTLNPALRGQNGVGVALSNPDRLYQMTRLFSRTAAGGWQDPGSERGQSSELDFLRRTAVQAHVSADRIRSSVRRVQRQAGYGENAFAQGLKLVAAMIAGGMDTRVYYLSLTGFDTHASQAGAHEKLLRTFGDGILAFQNDLEELGHADRVVGMAFSEFGRRAGENGSKGTDHGQAAPMFVFGAPVDAGFFGRHPSLEGLDDGDLKFDIDFRSVYATLIEGWLGADAVHILGSDFGKLPII